MTALPADLIQFFELCDLYVTVQEHTMCKEQSPEKSFEELMLRFVKAAEEIAQNT